MLSKIKPFLLGYVRSRCVFEPLKIMVKPGYCSFNYTLVFGGRIHFQVVEAVPGVNVLIFGHLSHEKLFEMFLYMVWGMNMVWLHSMV